MSPRSIFLFLCLSVGVLSSNHQHHHQHARRATPTASSAPAGPTHPGTATNCNKFYTVQSGDDCSIVEAAFAITHTQFIQWNPAVSQDCISNFWPTYSYCVGVGVVSSTSRATSTSSAASSTSVSSSLTSSTGISSSGSSSRSSSLSSTTTANATYSIRNPVTDWNITTPTKERNWPPTQTKVGQPAYCDKWHLVGSGESCDTVVALYSTTMDLSDLLEWNPTLGDDCSGLYFNWWVCVGVKSQSSLTLVYPTSETGPVTVPPPSTFVPTPYPTINSSFVATPTQVGLASDCQGFYKAIADDSCPKVLAQFAFLTREQFLAWNPALGADCAMWVGYYYCIADYASSNALPFPPTVTVRPSPVQTDIVSICQSWYMMTVDDTCNSISAMFGTFSESDFITWNPAVYGDCSELLEGYWYCVAIPSTPKTRTSGVTTTTFPSDNPKQTGIAADCKSYWVVSSSDTCESIASFNGISLTNFYAWNPAVGSTTCSNLLPGYYVCVGENGSPTSPPITSSSASPTISSSTTSSSTSRTTTSSAVGGVTTPAPTQAGMIPGCVRFYYVNVNEGCWDIANNNGITLDNFYAWNQAAAPDCAGLWANVYVCIGISGSPTTIAPKPT